jgi:hypothetical protein
MTIGQQNARRILPWILAAAPLLVAPAALRADPIQFNRDILPVLSDNCFLCHGPDRNTRKAKLRLDLREVALERGAIVPGKPGESQLIHRIFTTDEDDVMPPPDSRKQLTAAQKNLLKQWIAEGAEYQPHWAYLKPERPAVPEIRNPKSEIRNPIDAFILAELRKRNIKPSPEADKRTLLRRLSLDLTGLPATPAEVAAFLKDKSSRAYERQVDRLLASPHFGERLAVPWLDVVRYADTVGYHGDQNQNIFPYRDYVINAFNQNMPFDQFTIEQLAGDLLPNPSPAQQVATGFNRLNMMTREGGAQAKEYLAKYQADRVRTVAATWLGSTMGCAECHDHKYDPFSTRDFYAMEAFFADLKQWGVYADYDYTPNPDLKGVGNDHPFPPEIVVDSPYLQQRLGKLRAEFRNALESSSAKLKTHTESRTAFDAWRQASRRFLKQFPTGWSTPTPEVALRIKDTNAVPATNFTLKADGTVAFSDRAKENTRFTLPLSEAWLAAIRLEIAPHAGSATHAGAKKFKGTAIVLSASLKSQAGDRETKLSFSHAEADHKQDRFAMSQPIIGVTGRWQSSPDHDSQTAVWLLARPVRVAEGDTLILNLGNANLASARVSVSPFAAAEPLNSGAGEALVQALARSSPTKTQREWLHQTYLLGTAWDADTFTKVQRLLADVRECRDGRAFTMVSESREPRITRVLPRGNWQDESGEIVEPATPHFLPPPLKQDGRRLTRLDLARWLVSRDNPLTARTVVNRYWREFFGRGLSAVVDDLGAQGEPPSHPELLDWLAVEFMESGWNTKHIVKLIVMSATYRQSSNHRLDLKDLDPANRLLAAQNPRRLEAEFVRDNALAIAGLLNPDLGGPSAHPYQPPDYYTNLQFPDRDYHPSTDERQYRRGVYAWWQRTFFHPMLANFDAPSREECTAQRVVSNTPQQMLTLLNDPTFVEAARVFAERVLTAKCESDEERIEFAFQRALARPAKVKEKSSLLSFLAGQREHYQADADESAKLIKVGLAPAPQNADVSELAAWTQVCRVILNLHETITRY